MEYRNGTSCPPSRKFPRCTSLIAVLQIGLMECSRKLIFHQSAQAPAGQSHMPDERLRRHEIDQHLLSEASSDADRHQNKRHLAGPKQDAPCAAPTMGPGSFKNAW